MALKKQTELQINRSRSVKRQSAAFKQSPLGMFRERYKQRSDEPVSVSTFEDELILAAERLAEKEMKEYNRKKISISSDFSKPVPINPFKTDMPTTPYVVSKTEKEMRERSERRLKPENSKHFCKWQMINMPHPFETRRNVKSYSPHPVLSGKSFNTSKDGSAYNMLPNLSELKLMLTTPKSGIYINSSKKFGISEEKRGLSSKKYYQGSNVEEEEGVPTRIINSVRNSSHNGIKMDEYIVKRLPSSGGVYGQHSGVNAFNSRDVGTLDDMDRQPCKSKVEIKSCLDQMRSRSSSRRIIRGTLESHSFTKISQPIVKDFNYGVIMGSCNQSDNRFPKNVRGKQGVCMSIAAYCYSIILHPSKWSELVMDDILEVGTKLCLDSIEMAHSNNLTKELELRQLIKYCIIENKKIYFEVYEPEIVGQVRSTNKKIFNIYKGLQLFFSRQRVGIIRSPGLNVLAWKEKHYYFFDAGGRKSDLYTCTAGRAILAYIYDLPELSTILLKRTVLDDRPFTISKVNVVKVVEKEKRAELDSTKLRTHHRIKDKNKSLLQTSFDVFYIRSFFNYFLFYS